MKLTALPPLLGRRAASLVMLTAERLGDPDTVARTASAKGNEEPVSGLVPWQGATLSHGHPGIAMFFGELARRDDTWSAVADNHLRAGLTCMKASPSDGLFLGPAAMAAAAQACAWDPSRYAALRERLIRWVADDQVKRIESDRNRLAGGRGVAWRSYDVVNGLTGTGRLLLDAVINETAAAEAAPALEATLTHLIKLKDPIPHDSLPDGTHTAARVPGWWVPPELEPVDQDRRTYPCGDFNLGMAHGVSGPLTLLSVAGSRGWVMPGQAEAVEQMATWLVKWTLQDAFGSYWPCRVSLEEELQHEAPQALFTRTAWCYGAPGVATALLAASQFLQRGDWRETAVGSMRDALNRPEHLWRLDGPTLCHGYAGLLATVARMASATGDADLTAAIPSLASKVMDFGSENEPFIFPHLTPDSSDGWLSATKHKNLAGAGLSEGAAGVACTLLELIACDDIATGSSRPLPLRDGGWDRAMLLC